MAQGRGREAAGANADRAEPGGWTQLCLAWRLLRDPRVAPRLKVAVPALVALYVVSPVDLVPDLLVGIGQVDDVGVIGAAVVLLARLLPRLAPDDLVAEHLAAMGFGRPRRAAGPASGPVIDVPYRLRK